VAAERRNAPLIHPRSTLPWIDKTTLSKKIRKAGFDPDPVLADDTDEDEAVIVFPVPRGLGF
jgi:hypothetical protein